MNTVEQQPMYEWKELPWQQIERRVFKLQKRIYRASSRGDVKAVHNLQQLLMNSWSAKCLATRRVTQDNQGKKTAGIDGVKSLTPAARLKLVTRLNLKLKAKPVRRVWIPKPGTTEKRGLGIPVMADRACQALVKLGLEPEWEAKFEANSYGFRPGRGCHDALRAIRSHINQQPKYVLDADIAQCFDRINHTALLDKLKTFPMLRRVIKAWLKAGIMDEETLFPTEEGTPQGGVISPLLANVALHGIETDLKASFPATLKRDGELLRHWQPTLIRYADDLVVLHRNLTIIEQAKQILSKWLAEMGLELKASKTRFTHTLEPYDGNVGFDFLGSTVRQYRVGKTHAPKTRRRTKGRLAFKTIIKPSKTAQERHYRKLSETVNAYPMVPQANLIKMLNPIIRGWTNYHSRNNATQTFNRTDYLMGGLLWHWAKRRHANKSAQWIKQRYWHRRKTRSVFAIKTGMELLRHDATAIQKHIKVAGARSPFDGDWSYWGKRLGRYPDLTKRQAQLLKRQMGKCSYCGLNFTSEDKLEIDHIIPRQQGGKDDYSNWQLLHRHCHDTKTARDKTQKR